MLLLTDVSVVLDLSASAACFGPGSLILLLENIFRRLEVGHRVYGFAINADLIVKVGAGLPASTSHITDPLAARDLLAHFDPYSGQVAVNRLASQCVAQ